jgi:hypothetical protein
MVHKHVAVAFIGEEGAVEFSDVVWRFYPA